MNMRNGIKNSCDVYFYEVARRLGIDKISAMAERLGLGYETGIPLPGERSGLVPTAGWKIATYGESWQLGETLITGIGQGFMLTTPLQLALMTARLATGTEVIPRLVRAMGTNVEGIAEASPLRQLPLGFDPAHLAIVHDGMNAVVNELGGTATRSAVTGEGMSMAGKTGTAQVRNISSAERITGVLDNEDLPWRLRDHALFVGFGPVEAPKYAVAVVVEHGGSGSRAAGPRARDIMQFALTRDPGSMPAIGNMVQTAGNDGGQG
jgi:penicillin-binding protein 2